MVKIVNSYMLFHSWDDDETAFYCKVQIKPAGQDDSHVVTKSNFNNL